MYIYISIKKKCIFNLVRKMPFWNILHRVVSMSKINKPNSVKIFGSNNPMGVSMISKSNYGHICLYVRGRVNTIHVLVKKTKKHLYH